MKKTYTFTSVVPLPVQQAYRLAADVERYPEFIRSVKSVQILAEEEGRRTVEIVFQHALLSVRHVGHATFHENERIEIRQSEGFGKSLVLTWEFEPAESEQSRATLELIFESSNKWLGTLAAYAIERISAEILDDFIARAQTEARKG